MSDLSPLSGVKRKLDFGAVRAALTQCGPRLFTCTCEKAGRRDQAAPASIRMEDRFHAVLHAGNYRLRSLLLRLNAASDGIENGIPSLLDRRDRIVDRDARFPFQFIGVILCALGA